MSAYSKFNFSDNNFVITFTKKSYSLTGSGHYWKNVPDSIESETVTPEFYRNYIQSIPFFANFGGRASCRAYRNYTAAGYIPVKVVTVSYDGCKKIVAEFSFRNK